MTPLGTLTSSIAALLAGAVIALVVLMEVEVVPDSDSYVEFSFAAGLSAPAFAIVGIALTRFSTGRFSLLAVVALVSSAVAFLWPFLFFLAYSNCPNNVC